MNERWHSVWVREVAIWHTRQRITTRVSGKSRSSCRSSRCRSELLEELWVAVAPIVLLVLDGERLLGHEKVLELISRICTTPTHRRRTTSFSIRWSCAMSSDGMAHLSEPAARWSWAVASQTEQSPWGTTKRPWANSVSVSADSHSYETSNRTQERKRE